MSNGCMKVKRFSPRPHPHIAADYTMGWIVTGKTYAARKSSRPQASAGIGIPRLLHPPPRSLSIFADRERRPITTTYRYCRSLTVRRRSKRQREIGVPAQKFSLAASRQLSAPTVSDACARGRKCIEGCIQEGRTISNVGCMPAARKRNGDDEIYKGYPQRRGCCTVSKAA